MKNLDLCNIIPPMTDFYVLVTASGHRFSYLLPDLTIEEAREEQIGFAENADNGVASLTTDGELARSWENSCATEAHSERRRV